MPALKAGKEIRLVPLDQLHPWEKNPRAITVERFKSLKVALQAAPQMMRARPTIALTGVDYAPDGTTIAGNMRLRAALQLVEEADPAFMAEFPDGQVPAYLVTLDESEAREWAFRDNNEYGDWDENLVAEMLYEHEQAGGSLELTGFGEDLIKAYLDSVRGDDPPPDDRRSTDLALSDVAIGDPEHVVERGEVWQLGPHLLVCSGVYDGHQLWAPLLTETCLFVPYPTPTVPLTTKAETHQLVLVQPDPWMAGHLIDKWVAVRGSDGVQRLGDR